MKTLWRFGRLLLAASALVTVVGRARAQKSDYYPLKTGDTWTYSGKVGDKTFTEIAVVKNMTMSGGAPRATIEWTINGQVVQTEIYTVSPQGISRIEGGQGGKLTPPLPTLKFPLSAGQKWAWKGSITVQGQAIPSDAAVTISGPVSIKTQAGAFMAMHVHTTIVMSVKGKKYTIPNDIWYARGVGPVQQDAQLGAQVIHVSLLSYKLK